MPPHCARNWVDNWKQTVGYFVTKGSMNPVIIQEALLDCIDFVRSAGLIPKVVICDQGSNNRSMISNLGVTVSCKAAQEDSESDASVRILHVPCM